jgi:hypothetical protein
MMSKPTTRSVILCAIGLAVAIQLVPINRDNPAAPVSVTAPAPVMSILQRSCYDCHSNNTRWPWYSYVAPVSWLVARDVHEGRRHMDLSAWSGYPPDTREKKLLDIAEAVQSGDMPLWFYLPLHSAARLTPSDVSAGVEWAKSSGAKPAR